jgi:hypothetical protein
VILPDVPIPGPIISISPTLYETLLTCPARAAWLANGRHDLLVQHPSAILDPCFHDVMEAAQRRQITGDPDECRSAARILFDNIAIRIHSEAHPLIRVKFPVSVKLPFYNLFRERAAALAADYAAQRQDGAGGGCDVFAVIAESRFESFDGLIVGRPDLVNISQAEVVDYKTGLAGDQPWRISEREARQLSLYVYLTNEAGLYISRGVIMRGNGERATIDIPPEMADAEAQRARNELARYDARIDGESFQDLAHPTPDACRMCPCQPICEAFWDAADTSWREACGVHIEGAIADMSTATVQGTSLLTMVIEASRGTLGAGEVTVEQIPESWTTADGDRCPDTGDVVRLVGARLVDDEVWAVRGDRVMTSLWRVEAGSED